MAIIKCKMCGGDVALSADKTFGTCEYCGSVMTFPKISDEQLAARFNRGNEFRRRGEFDKALAVYEGIVREEDENAEAHWCCALCRFGIEYVEDPATFEYIPTCHRASFDSFLEDMDYLAAIEYSDGVTKRQYQRDAMKIAEVQKGILATSQNEEPFDVFICYKETDDNGERTRDSLMAQDVYYQLTEAGYRVFFSRITLEDKAGAEFEPYIFAALNSAKVMVAIGTKPEHFNAVWVKNEWSRFLAFMRKDRSKLLLPCYKDMDPYELPEQLSVLQSYDMAKIGFIQDLIRGIKKVIRKNENKPKETVIVQQPDGGFNAETTALLERGYMALEDGEWDKANEFFEQVLNRDAKNAEAYLGQKLAQERAKSFETFAAQRKKQLNEQNLTAETFYAVDEDKEKIDAAVKEFSRYNLIDEREIRGRFNFDRSYDSYVKACEALIPAEKRYWQENRLLSKAARFAEGEFKTKFMTAENEIVAMLNDKLLREKQRCEKAKEEREKAYFEHIDTAYKTLSEQYDRIILKKYNEAAQAQEIAQMPEEFHAAARLFGLIEGYRDAAKRREECFDGEKNLKYTAAVNALKAAENETDFRKAAALFDKIISYKDAARRKEECLQKENEVIRQREAAAKRAGKKRRIVKAAIAAAIAAAIGLYFLITKVFIPLAEDMRDMRCYKAGEKALKTGKYSEALGFFDKARDYSDAKTQAKSLRKQFAPRAALAAGEYHTVGLKSDGTVVAVGVNGNGQRNVNYWRDIIAVAAAHFHTVGLKADGTVVATGFNGDGQCDVSGWEDIIAVAAGNNHTVGLKSDGTVVAVGDNFCGQCNVSDWRDIIAVAAGGYHTVGLKSDGTVVATGSNDDGQCKVNGWRNIIAVAAGRDHTVGLKADGTVVAVGYNGYGQCDVSGWRDIIAVAAGEDYTVGLKADGTVVAVGMNYGGQCNVSDWRDIIAVAAGDYHTVGLKSNGTVVATKIIESEYVHDGGQCNVNGWKNIGLPKAD